MVLYDLLGKCRARIHFLITFTASQARFQSRKRDTLVFIHGIITSIIISEHLSIQAFQKVACILAEDHLSILHLDF